MNFNRVCDFFLREAIRRNIPHGLVHWRYFLPGQSKAICIHRTLWVTSMPRLPRSLYFLLEAGLWVKWVLWGAWRGSFRCVSRWGKRVREKEGIPILRQAIVVLRLALGYCLPPSWIYCFQLYREPQRVWEYVYEHEIQTFHRLRGRALGERRESLELLQDKLALSEKMQAMELPVAETLALVSKGGKFDFSKWSERKLFCKTRHGSRAEGAFIVEILTSEIKLFPFAGGKVVLEDEEKFLRENLAKDDYLVQPCYQSHPLLANLTTSEEAITVRLISENESLYFAWLEIPVHSQGARQVHVLLPIDLETGEVLLHPGEHFSAAANEIYRAVHEKLEGLYVPYWRELVSCAREGQKLFPDIHAVAWDFVVTGEGPVLLEGNSGWGAMDEQMLCGGFLK